MKYKNVVSDDVDIQEIKELILKQYQSLYNILDNMDMDIGKVVDKTQMASSCRVSKSLMLLSNEVSILRRLLISYRVKKKKSKKLLRYF